jgi:hypothetical protein
MAKFPKIAWSKTMLQMIADAKAAVSPFSNSQKK